MRPGKFQRRITLAYRVLDPYEGETVLERKISNAHQTAQEVSAGAADPYPPA
ncbi:hypothetical protein [Streptomyces sp. NPDC059979]|uniref:hypothetical protein n=1 Tax=unclassified Streptomyces TaxID=2593676 RepID=UPI00366137C2